MPSSWWMLLFRALAALGLGASALLLVEYTSEAPQFCGSSGDCGLVRASPYAKLFGLHTPVYGIAFFLFVLVASFAADELVRRLVLLASIVGAVGAAAFIAIMVTVVHALCVYCLMVDGSAIALALVAVLTARRAWPDTGQRLLAGSAVVIIVALASPFLYAQVMHGALGRGGLAQPGVPDCVVREQQQGAVTVVVFGDFMCPYCRAEHFALRRIVDELGGNVRVVHKNFPLPAHAGAVPAALAGICAEEMGQGDLMADQLFAAESFSPTELEQMADRLGLELTAWRACLAAKGTLQRLADDRACAEEAQVNSLPTFYIGNERFEALQKDDLLRTRLVQALEGARPAETQNARQ